jgi:predicted transglutaminase-like cysteine proteinase
MKQPLDRLLLDAHTLMPFAHTVFCLEYPQDCVVRKIAFRGQKFQLTPARMQELMQVNGEVNRDIRPERNTQGLAGEKWIVSPSAGDCNDYAVTKQHELLARGWPSRTLLLAEVVTNWGEHHLVVVVRTAAGDLLLDNLTPSIRPWSKAPYRWVRVQSPTNPKAWMTVR